MKNVEFLEVAESELSDAYEYYEYQQKNLGLRFINEVYNAIELIQYYPEGWSKNSANTRRCLVKTFPYGIIYQNRKDKILVIAIANLHRKPNYWANRI
ncbi:MAG TPA: type II toxin-antitoxin system RelE/ParE family toxin [Campylobacteraceae bacterium]|jgi:plasmid stabilization system protein ParE|nr:type II toxin-antitoxin system RelE/ParE family toxin [Campylobacteraceae bacterium]